jgi:VIT1/CCC1 family predicted Fe2+/Mn2+ transporter
MNADRDRREGAQTRLGRTVRTTIATAVASSSRHREHHRTTNWLRDVILGGQDGLVNILGVIAGGGSKTVLLAAGFAAAITESISMGAVGYTSSVSQRDYYQAERAREVAEIDTMPEAERQEIREIYATKGFSGDLLDRVVDTITANRDSWLSTMMDEELHLQPVQTADIFRSAVVITVATLIASIWIDIMAAAARATGPAGRHQG